MLAAMCLHADGHFDIAALCINPWPQTGLTDIKGC